MREVYNLMTINNDFNITLFVLKPTTSNSIHITRMASLVICQILVAMVTIFWKSKLLSYKGDDAYKMQKSYAKAIHTATCDLSNERGRSRDTRSDVIFF